MRAGLLFASVLLLASSGAYAQWGNIQPGNHYGPPPPAGCAQGSLYADGCPGAPTGTIQFPTLRASYAHPAPFNFAGADYYAGIPTGTSLVDPSTISMSGVTVNASAHTVTISGNNVTLSGINYGLDNGWELFVNGANDIVQNSLFTVGSNQGSQGTVLSVSTSASNFSFLDNEVNGANIPVTSQVGYTLGFANTGSLTIQYNYLHNSGGDMVELNNINVSPLLIRYNLFYNIGLMTPHSDTVQFCGSRVSAGKDEFNTVYQATSGLNGEGLMVNNSECTGSAITNLILRDNTLLSKVSDNFLTGQTITQDAGSASGSKNTVYDNWVDPTGINAAGASPWFPTGFYTSTLGTPAALYGMTNMISGATIAVPTVTTKYNGFYTYPDSASYSPSLSSIFSITPSPASGNVTTGQTVTFTLLMNAVTVVSGTPTIALNSGGTASYVSGSGTNTLVFSYTVQSGNTASTLAVTSISGTAKDDVGNPTLFAPLTNLTTSFTGLSVNSGGATLAFTVLNGGGTSSTTTGSGTYTVTVPTGLTSCSYGGGLSGSSTASGFSASGGTWSATFTTPASAGTGTLTCTGVTNVNTVTSPSATFTGGGGGAPVVNVTSGSFTGSIASSGGQGTLTTSGSVSGTLTYNQLLENSGAVIARIINSPSSTHWNLDTPLTASSTTLTSITPFWASSTSGTVSGTPPTQGPGKAQTGQTIGTVTATNSPTGFAITGCTAPGSVDCTGWFSVNSSGVVTVTSTGATNIAPTNAGAIYDVTFTATNGSGTSPGQMIPIVFFNDGALSASSGGTITNPTLFSGYSFRPPWQVAGVDYAVGTPGGTLNVAASGNLPAGCSGGSSGNLTCNTAGITIQGWDFYTHCYAIIVEAANISIIGNKLGCATAISSPPIDLIGGNNNTYIAYNTINQNGILDTNTSGAQIYQSSGGSFLAEYNVIENSGEDVVDVAGGASAQQYNYETNDGQAGGGVHPDFMQPQGSLAQTSTYQYVTAYQDNPPGGGSQGFSFGDNSTPQTGTQTFNNGVLVATGSNAAINEWIRLYSTGAAGYTVTNNYVDLTQAGSFWLGTGNGTLTIYNNVSFSGATITNTP
jgi:hypothetical protein